MGHDFQIFEQSKIYKNWESSNDFWLDLTAFATPLNNTITAEVALLVVYRSFPLEVSITFVRVLTAASSYSS